MTNRRAAQVGGVAALISILAVAAFLRFVELATNPGGLFPDEAAEGLDALRMLHQPGFHPDWLVWFQGDGGREALFAYVVAGAFRLFGESALVLRETAAAIGVMGVLGIAWLAKRWGWIAALTAAGWAAGSLWLICVSRDGMRNTIVPIFGALALVALLGWMDRPGRWRAALTGGLIALASLYTYQPLKLLPVIVVIWLFWLRRTDRERYDAMRPGFGAFVAAFAVVAAPIAAVAITEASNYFGRAASVSPINPEVDATGSIPDHILRTIGMFGFFGDANARQDVDSIPLLPIPLAIVGATGVWRLWRLRRRPAESLILLSLAIFMVAPLIAVEGYAPHSLRALGLVAPLGVAIGVGARELVMWARRRGIASATVVGAALALVLALTATWSGWLYLNRPLTDRWDAYSYPVVSLADAAREHPGAAVIADRDSAMVVLFLDYSNAPTMFEPGARIDRPRDYPAILAGRHEDLVAALGAEMAGTAKPIAWDPWGNVNVWIVTP